jgi:RNA polymerase sigma-70 factor, ECF subfamily
MPEDSVYIDQFLGGNSQGFEMLVRKYQNKALNIVYSLIGNDRESEDIVQEAFIKMYHGLKSFNRRSQFSTWAYRIVVNTAYDFLRRRKHFVQDEVVLENIPSGTEDPRAAQLSREKEALIRAALERVPLKFRTPVVLRDIEGLSYMEISQVLRCSIGTVESRIYRARQFLKDELLRGEARL